MTNNNVEQVRRAGLAILGAAALLGFMAGGNALAASPIVQTVPADPANPLAFHDIISGRPTTLKGTADESCAAVCTWSWDPGDGSPAYTGDVDFTTTNIFDLDNAGYNPYYAIWAEHTYAGSPGDVFIATLTVDNGVDPTASKTYRMQVRPNTLPNEVNAAIDEALWHMHRNQLRFSGDDFGNVGGTIPMGRWDYPQTSGNAIDSPSGASVNAFEANGYLETGPATSPYSDTVARGLAYLFTRLNTQDISNLQDGENADINGNGIGLRAHTGESNYHLGMVMDAIIASQNPAGIAAAGNADVKGRTYADIAQDMVEWYSWSQIDFGSYIGGWDYNSANNASATQDNSTAGWAAIGLIAAEDVFGSTIPAFVKTRLPIALEATDNESDVSTSDGVHGYRSTSSLWGHYSVSAAALVQMDLAGIESSASATPDERWIRTENLFRRDFNFAASGNNFKNYYYAMFNFAKGMRLANPPVTVIGTNDSVGCGPVAGCVGGTAPLDWYNDSVDGLARTVVDYQITSGVNIGGFTDRPGNSHGSNQDDHNTPWATQILTRSLFVAGPIARATANPNPTSAGVPVTFDGSTSTHQDPARSIVLYEWDFDDDGVYDASGVTAVESFPCPVLPCSYPVTLRVTDDSNPALTAEDVVVIEVTIPPHPPTADAGGPYLVCVDEELTLDGSGSFDIDEGLSESGNPPFDTITSWGWELDGVSPFDFDEASGETATVTYGSPQQSDIGLRVTDNTSQAFPTSGQPDLTDSDFTSVDVADCSCIGPLTTRRKITSIGSKIAVVWTPVVGAATYDIYRSLIGPNVGFTLRKADHATNYAVYVDFAAAGVPGLWYRIVPKDGSGVAICGSSEAARVDLIGPRE